MKAYFVINNAKDKIIIDCIEMQNKINKEKLFLTFKRNEVGLETNGSCYIRQSILNPEEYGVPNSLKDNFGDTECTYEFIKNCKIISIILYDIFTNKLDNLVLSNLLIYISDYCLDFKYLDDIKLEKLCE